MQKLTINHQPSTIRNGFTLIEVLVVMLIIGILAGLSLFALGGARESARDGRRKADLEAVRSALEIYKADCDVYPDPLPDAGDALEATCVGSSANTYMEEIPGDPLDGTNYFYSTTTTTYDLCAVLEDPPSSPDSCSGCPTCNYLVTNP